MTANPIHDALDELRRRREEINAAIAVLAPLAGEPMEAPDETIVPAGGTKPARRATKAVKGETTRPTDALSEAAIRTALKNGATTPKTIVKDAKLPLWKVNKLLGSMLQAGAVTKTGQQRAVRYSLA